MIKGKKANVFDGVDNSLGLLGLGMVVIIVGIILFKFGTNILTNPFFSGSIFSGVKNWMLTFGQYLEWLVPLIYILTLGFSIYWASKIESDIKLIFVGIFLSFILAFSMWVVGKIWTLFKAQAVLSDVVNQLVISDFMLTHSIWFAMGYEMLVLVFLYGAKGE